MALIRSLKGITPSIAPDVFLAENAVIIGDVEIGAGSSVWYHAVLRGDVHSIRVGERTNIQDLVMVHCTYKTNPTIIGHDITIGHGAVVHGCVLEGLSLIGMKAVVLDKAVVEPEVVLGAGSVVLEGMRLESGWLYAGTPAKKIKPLTEVQKAALRTSAEGYQMYASWYREE